MILLMFWLYISAGAPPETIKDSMVLGLDIATNFVIVGEMFDRITGINTAEVEFPVSLMRMLFIFRAFPPSPLCHYIVLCCALQQDKASY